MNEYKVTTTISSRKIADQVVTAFEGGITYWATTADLRQPSRESLKKRPWYDEETLYEQDFSIEIVQDEEHEQGAGKSVWLNPQNIQRGLEVMAAKYTRHFNDLVSESGDADTADVFIQCCVFGELVYG